MSVREKCLWIVCIVLLLSVILLALWNYKANIALNFLRRVRPDMSEQQVVHAVGKPKWVFKKGEKIEFPRLNIPGGWQLPDLPRRGKAYIYIRHPIFLWAFAVYFDEDNKVICVAFDDT